MYTDKKYEVCKQMQKNQKYDDDPFGNHISPDALQSTHLHPNGQVVLPSYMMKLTYSLETPALGSNDTVGSIFLGCLDFEEDSTSGRHTFERGWEDPPDDQRMQAVGSFDQFGHTQSDKNRDVRQNADGIH